MILPGMEVRLTAWASPGNDEVVHGEDRHNQRLETHYPAELQSLESSYF